MAGLRQSEGPDILLDWSSPAICLLSPEVLHQQTKNYLLLSPIPCISAAGITRVGLLARTETVAAAEYCSSE